MATRLQTKSSAVQDDQYEGGMALDKPRFCPRALCTKPVQSAQGLVVQWFHRMAQTMILPENLLKDNDETAMKEWEQWAQWPLVCLSRELCLMGWTRSQIIGAFHRAWAKRPTSRSGTTMRGWAEAYDILKTWLPRALDDAAQWVVAARCECVTVVRRGGRV